MSHRRRSDLPPSRTTDRTPNPKSCRGGGGDRREKMSSWSSRGVASAVFSSKRRVWDNGRCSLPSEPSIRCWFRPTSTRTSTGSHSRSPNASFSGIISSLSPSQEQLCTSIPFDSNIDIRYGHLTWEWKKGIRSYLHPLPFALLYKIMAFLRLDTPWFMVKVPRLLQSFFATFGDLYLYKLSKLVFDEHVARWALFCQLANWFMFFCITRTLSNSLETVLTVIGIFLWLSAGGSSKGSAAASRKGLLVAALACAIRPTSAITWLYVGLLDLIGLQSRFEFLFFEGFGGCRCTFI